MSVSSSASWHAPGDYTPYRLPVDLVGPEPSCLGYIFVHPLRGALDLDYSVVTRIVRVGAADGSGLEFTRSTCYQYLPQVPRSSADFLVPHTVDSSLPVNVYVLAPTSRETALDAVTYAREYGDTSFAMVNTRYGREQGSFAWDGVPLEETFFDVSRHRRDLFCAVFINDLGVFEVARIFSIRGQGVISATSLIFAPSAWRHAARVVARIGEVSRQTTRLLCRLSSGDVVKLVVDSAYVDVEDGWFAPEQGGSL
ncbi:hypothetical protein C8R47DRAFT_1208180 [Mycena vitilis]|nr:hypothetical protein C8R47DRAFT_1208180 [Mycena vitilis]